jgi:peptide/nickel transport system substrate-binding protein
MRERLLLLLTLVTTVAGGTGAAEAHAIRNGGTFRVGVDARGEVFNAIDPALSIDTGGFLRPACGALMAYPDKSLPAGLILGPDLAEKAPRVSNGRRTYMFTIRRDARFSTGARVTARDAVHTLERVFDPNVKSLYAPDFSDIVGASKMLAGKATRLSGAIAQGRRLTVTLTKPVPDFPARTTELCIVPASVPADPEGAKAPLPSAAPYYVSSYVPDARVVLDRNRFYRGRRPHHVDRIDIDLNADPDMLLNQVATQKLEYATAGPWLAGHAAELARRYGVNKSQFFVKPGLGTQMFVLNASRPLFRNNARLRQAVNFAVDRRAILAAERGPLAETPTDRYIPQAMPGFKNVQIYPPRPNLRRARAVARGHVRSRKAVLYTCTDLDCTGPAQILRRNLEQIGLEVVIKEFPRTIQVPKLSTPGEPYDIARVGFVGSYFDPATFASIFDGRTIGKPGSGNFSHFKSAAYDRALDRANRLTGRARNRAFAALDANLARLSAPAIAYANTNEISFVSKDVGCVTVNPQLDLTAVCLK